MKRLQDHIASELNPISEDKLHERYDEMLDCEGTVKAGGYDFYPSKILSECDPTAYRCGFNDWLDSCRDEYVEFNGDYYERDKFEDAVESLISDIESEISDLEKEIEDTEGTRNDEGVEDSDVDAEIDRLNTTIAELTTDIAAIKKEANV